MHGVLRCEPAWRSPGAHALAAVTHEKDPQLKVLIREQEELVRPTRRATRITRETQRDAAGSFVRASARLERPRRLGGRQVQSLFNPPNVLEMPDDATEETLAALVDELSTSLTKVCRLCFLKALSDARLSRSIVMRAHGDSTGCPSEAVRRAAGFAWAHYFTMVKG